VYVRNQRLKASQETHQLEPGGCGLGCNAHLHDGVVVWGTLWLGDVAGREATLNACGVVVAKLQGHSWTPTLSNDSTVNVGTISMAPSSANSQLVDGKTHRQSMLSRWGGGPVVVRARESRVHGEGVQRVRSINVDRGGRR